MVAETDTWPDTPLMRQYRALKERHPNAVVLFRLGDFYEMFGDDARTAAPLLGLFLTSRQGVSMCGIPHHASRGYIAKLLKAGQKVALAEQTEEPGPGKKLISRSVTRLITPGTVVEDEFLEPVASNYLAAVVADIVGWGAAWLDVSTGEFWATEALNDPQAQRLSGLLAKTTPAEILADARAADLLGLQPHEAPPLEKPQSWNDPRWLNRPLALKAAWTAFHYALETLASSRDSLPAPEFREPFTGMQLDENAIRTLELVSSVEGGKRNSLWGLLDLAHTPMGSRKIRTWALNPSTDLAEIERRQNSVEELLAASETGKLLGARLKEISDLPRAISRLAAGEAKPRDLEGLRHSLGQLPKLNELLAKNGFSSSLLGLATSLGKLSQDLEPAAALLAKALADRPSARLADGGVIRDGFNAELDELRLIRSDSQGFLQRLEAAEREATGISSLKAGYNSVFGYYFEVSKANQAKVPPRYSRRQTLTNAERYITPELKELETKIMGAEEKILRLEARLFEEVRREILKGHALFLRLAETLAELDALLALSAAAAMHEWVKPVVDLSYDLIVREGRHPVLDVLLPAQAFVPNSLEMNSSDRRIVILTGPNMAGKSTYLRQNALIAIMAQMGSFVPAAQAKIGLVDKVLTRIGSQDALAKGDSTFMVEMKEVSHILRTATPRSLLVLDEVGRGTSTFDGISIAWAMLEHLHGSYAQRDLAQAQGPRVLFATHYFEITDMAENMDGVANYNVEAKEWTDASGKTSVVFLHKISPGPADRSYGIHVAALAGLPAACLARAREILTRLENESSAGRWTVQGRTAPDEPKLPLFEDHPVLQTLRLLDTDKMTPMEALSALASLKKTLN